MVETMGAELVSRDTSQLLGRVAALWRYPVKSMLGESLQCLSVDRRGGCGDRGWALWDHATSRVASAKNPRLWSELLGYRARYLAEPEAEALPRRWRSRRWGSPTDNPKAPTCSAQAQIWPGGSPACLGAR